MLNTYKIISTTLIGACAVFVSLTGQDYQAERDDQYYNHQYYDRKSDDYQDYYACYNDPEYDYANDYLYIKMGVQANSLGRSSDPMPMIGMGKRYEWNEDAIDVSFNYANGKSGNYFATYPRIVYLHYLSPYSTQSFYVGGGMSWGSMKAERHYKAFNGIMAEGVIGYEMQRYRPIRPFVELGITQPMLATNGGAGKQTPAISMTFGLGF